MLGGVARVSGLATVSVSGREIDLVGKFKFLSIKSSGYFFIKELYKFRNFFPSS